MGKKKFRKGCNFPNVKKCPHNKYEFIEYDKKHKIVYARCYYCFALFKFSEKEWGGAPRKHQ